MAQRADLEAEVEDLETARLLISSLQSKLAKSEHDLAKAKRENTALKHQLDVLCRRMFGKKSERVDPRQLALALEQLDNESGGAADPVEMDSCETAREPKRRGKRPRGRQALPRELPRRVVVVDIDEPDKVCDCGREKQRIGELVSEKLDYVPASFEVIETVTPKYACPRCHEGVTSATAPPQAVEKGLAAEGLLAHVVVSKYVDHLPLYRQERIFARHGVELGRSTLCGFVEQVADSLEPIATELKRQVLNASYLQTDDTPVVVLKEDKGSFKGRLWTYLDPLEGQVVFDATPTHERDGPERFLESFQGYLQADAYTGYDALYRSGRIVEVACWAHGRRRFVEALETDARAARILRLVQRLYEVERDASEVSFEQRQAMRQERSAPLLLEIDEQRQELERVVLPKSPLGDALRYLGNQWTALGRFLEDGRLAIDNNRAESQLRVVAVGRKNWLFAGSMAGAHRAALLYSLVQSCRLAKIDPFVYFRDVLLRVATHPHHAVDELVPRAWAQQFAAHAFPASATA